MTVSKGYFTEDRNYVLKNEKPKPPNWKSVEVPDPHWTVTPADDGISATAVHPQYPTVVFVWDKRMDYVSGVIVWHTSPSIQSAPHICTRPELFHEFMNAMMRLADIRFNKVPPNMIEVM